MDYEFIEDLVTEAKSGDLKAKEMLMVEFTPLIRKLSRTSIIHGYEREDLQNECYKTLLICIFRYNCESHRFTAYATNAIKNNINNLIKITCKRSNSEGNKALIMDDVFIGQLAEDDEHFEDKLCNQAYNSSIKDFVSRLNDCDKDLINFVFYEHKQLKEYSNLKNINYSTVLNRKNIALRNLKKIIDDHEPNQNLN